MRSKGNIYSSTKGNNYDMEPFSSLLTTRLTLSAERNVFPLRKASHLKRLPGEVQLPLIRNRYNYQTPSVQDTKGKEGRTWSNGTTMKTLQAEVKKDSFFSQNWPNGYPK